MSRCYPIADNTNALSVALLWSHADRSNRTSASVDRELRTTFSPRGRREPRDEGSGVVERVGKGDQPGKALHRAIGESRDQVVAIGKPPAAKNQLLTGQLHIVHGDQHAPANEVAPASLELAVRIGTSDPVAGARPARRWTRLLRRAEPADALQVAEVHVRAWQEAYRGLLPDDYLDALRPEERAGTYRFGIDAAELPITVVAVEGDRVHGFARMGASLDDDRPGSSQLYAIYVHPDHWRSGIGRMLLSDARVRLVGGGFAVAHLWSMVGNERAAAFYRADGWEADGARRSEEVHGVVVPAERYQRRLVS